MKKTDVLIIGTGLAGLFTALNIDKNLKVCIISKTKIEYSNSVLAQGGIACEYNDDDKLHQEHINDTLKAGSYLNDKKAVEFLVENAYESVKKLISFGVQFDIGEDNKFLVTKEGGHSSRRIFHSGGDATGKNVTSTLIAELMSRDNITFLSETMAVNLITENDIAIGMICLNEFEKYQKIFAKKIVIATGGIGSVYNATTNDLLATGDGIGIAYRKEVKISHMEFIQFHPTAFYDENSHSRQRFLITEALRGEGAKLINVEEERFMKKYSPDLMELAPRDIVSQAIFREMYDTWTDHVYLDTRHLDAKFLKERFPTIFNYLKEHGLILGVDLIPVSPCEHFLCGGIETNLNAKTTIKNLYAVGETANSGVHGANRLASNSLLECLVFAKSASDDINKTIHANHIIKDIELNNNDSYKYNYKPIRKKIGDYMDEHVSIVRDEAGLKLSLKTIQKIINNLKKYPNITKNYYETLNLATTAYLITKQALEREESIGCHYRID
ncbi:MAG: L-aspartate oxidase [Candidatus Izimaplasma sp.]|nr:L-aspartate oxidase [Candidatus Izimaplasma bacterium]